MASGLIGGLISLFRKPPGRDLAAARIGDEVIVRGIVVPRDLIESPLSGERCVYYAYSVDEFRPSVDGIGSDGFWNTIERDEAIAEFYLQVGPERLIVAPRDADVDRARGPKMRRLAYDVINRRASEMVIEAGDEIEVHGVVAAADDLFDDGRDYRAMPHRRMLQAPERGTLKIRWLGGAAAARQAR